MKKLATNILAFTLATIFLMSFTGVRLLIHHCLGCDTTDITLFSLAAEDCNSMHHKHTEATTCHISFDGDGHTGCCPGDDNDDPANSCQNCCKTEVHYLKKDYDMQPERNEKRIEAPVLAVLFHFVAPYIPEELPSNLSQQNHTDTEPPTPVGRDFVIYAQHLKIAC